jgi:C-terminal binding protein
MGYDNVDIKYCGENGIVVSNVPDYGTEEVADAAMSLILCLLRNTFKLGVQTTVNGIWPGQSGMKGARRVRGMTLGIVGFGRIGKCTTIRAKAFGMNVTFYDPYVEHGIDKSFNVKRMSSLDELLAESDVVSVHCLLTPETKHLINVDNIFKMKKDALLVNTARGPIVEEKAVVNALQNGHLAGVGLDVLEIEPYQKNLMYLENLIITPHSAFYSEEGYVEMREKAAIELNRILKKEKECYCVNKQF